MATVTITISDVNNSEIRCKINFNPTLSNNGTKTNAQGIALMMLASLDHLIQEHLAVVGRRISPDEERRAEVSE